MHHDGYRLQWALHGNDLGLEIAANHCHVTHTHTLRLTSLPLSLSRVVCGIVHQACATRDETQKKMIYFYLEQYAHANPDYAMMAINTLQKEFSNSNPTIRGLALRSISYLRLKVTHDAFVMIACVVFSCNHDVIFDCFVVKNAECCGVSGAPDRTWSCGFASVCEEDGSGSCSQAVSHVTSICDRYVELLNRETVGEFLCHAPFLFAQRVESSCSDCMG